MKRMKGLGPSTFCMASRTDRHDAKQGTGVDSRASKLPPEDPFYFPDPDLFRHPDAYPLLTGFAARLEEAGLAGRFPPEIELRHIAIELLA